MNTRNPTIRKALDLVLDAAQYGADAAAADLGVVDDEEREAGATLHAIRFLREMLALEDRYCAPAPGGHPCNS